MKRRYKNEEQILKAIDRNNAAIHTISLEIDRIEGILAPGLTRSRTPQWQIEGLEMELHRLKRSLAARSGEKRQRLADCLSIFRTPQIPVLDNGDTSVPA